MGSQEVPYEYGTREQVPTAARGRRHAAGELQDTGGLAREAHRPRVVARRRQERPLLRALGPGLPHVAGRCAVIALARANRSLTPWRPTTAQRARRRDRTPEPLSSSWRPGVRAAHGTSR